MPQEFIMSIHRSVCALLVLAAGAATSFAQSTVPVKLVFKEGDAIAGSTISSLNSPFTDGNGRMAALVILADGSRVILDESLSVVFNSSTIGSPVLTGGEGTIGISNAGGYIYSPSIDGEDGVFSNGGSLLRGTDAAPGLAGLFTTFCSRPTMRPDGTAQWVSGTSATSGGTTSARVIYQNPTPGVPANTTPVMVGGDVYGGLATTAQGLGFDYSISNNGLHRIHQLTAAGAPTTSDTFIAADDVLIAREGSPAPVGNWSGTLRNVSINNSGIFAFAADTTEVTSADEIIYSNAGMIMQEGTVVGGAALAGTCNALSVNNLGDIIFTWGTGATEVLCKGTIATMPGSAVKLLQVNDLADINNDGTGDFTVIDFEASATIGPGLDLADDGRVFVEVTLRPIGGTSTDDFEAILRFPTDPAGCPADLDNDGVFPGGTPDGGVDINDLLFFLAAFEGGDVAADLDNDGDPAVGTPDGGVDINDLLFFLARFEAGC